MTSRTLLLALAMHLQPAKSTVPRGEGGGYRCRDGKAIMAPFHRNYEKNHTRSTRHERFVAHAQPPALSETKLRAKERQNYLTETTHTQSARTDAIAISVLLENILCPAASATGISATSLQSSALQPSHAKKKREERGRPKENRETQEQLRWLFVVCARKKISTPLVRGRIKNTI